MAEEKKTSAGQSAAAATAGAAHTAGETRPESGKASVSRKKAFPFSKARGITALLVFVVLAVGIVFRLGGGTLSSFGLGSIAVSCPLGALEVMLGAKEFMLHPFLLLLVVVVIVLLTGKAFCAWACPVPWVQRLLRPGKKKRAGKDAAGDASGESAGDAATGVAAVEQDELAASASDAAAATASAAATSAPAGLPEDDAAYELFPQGSKAAGHSCHTCGACEALKAVGGKRDGLRIDSRHAVLLGALGSAAIFGFPVFCLVCPIGLTFALFIGVWNAFQFNEPSIALLAAAVLLVLELTVLRKWCANFCPMGALIGLISGANRTFKPAVDADACLRGKGIDCHACVDACPEELDPHSGKLPECSKCGACVEACPAQAIQIKVLAAKISKPSGNRIA